MLEIKIIKHKNIENSQLKDICQIKSIFGNYTLESQLNWIENNIGSDDIHLLIYDNYKLIAYTNLIEETLLINNENINILGIGNVCVDEKGKNKGTLLIKNVNKFLYDNQKIGLLFCKKNLIPFYKKTDWILIEPSYSEEIYWMIFNYNLVKNENIFYTGKLF